MLIQALFKAFESLPTVQWCLTQKHVFFFFKSSVLVRCLFLIVCHECMIEEERLFTAAEDFVSSLLLFLFLFLFEQRLE